MSMPRFHLAFPVRDLEEARRFYGGTDPEHPGLAARDGHAEGRGHAIHHRAADPLRGTAGGAGNLFLDPSGNALELKAFADESMIFAR